VLKKQIQVVLDLFWIELFK